MLWDLIPCYTGSSSSADYDMILEWKEGGVKVYDSMCDEEDEMYESDDSSCDDLVEED